MDNYCLKWNQFETNVRETFKKLKNEQRLSDVTLATGDGHHIYAHKIVLSVGSDFFEDMFVKSNNPHLMIYFKGISRIELENIIAFLYNGEVSISQEELQTFLNTAQELKVKGLQGDINHGIEDNIPSLYSLEENASENLMGDEERVSEAFYFENEIVSEPLDIVYNETKLKSKKIKDITEVDLQLEEMVKKIEG